MKNIAAALLLVAWPGCQPTPDPVPPTPPSPHVTDAGPAPSSSCAVDCAALNAKLRDLPGGSKPVDCAKQCAQ